eukprot:CAMPEP_0202980378 /NCGR_PEP_ID=MMETSP1396-20130829/86319_1 /ASSEMBLY_ACC=CAM_ASM_000872 /TAXON_ID= /ORGANISM="Pseudokeronopsis sp., Strain Brazil" /LENGTH=119 /DNA_ID=CAMNT_0049720325 /DNA_START=676 /DNA_END=1035 /DNA_ORIENTATION=+
MIETLSLLASMITIYCSLYYISDKSNSPYADPTRTELELSEGVKTFFFVVIIIVNLSFFLYWSWKFYQESKLMFVVKYGKIYMLLCLCCDKQKLAREQRQAEIHMENQLMYNELNRIFK